MTHQTLRIANDNAMGYEIVDRHTGLVVGKAKTLSAARRSVDKRDLAYGAYRYFARRITG